MSTKRAKGGSNHIAEWYGHRVFPTVSSVPIAISDQRAGHCPFLSTVTGTKHACVKEGNSKGVCTVSANSNGSRQDWLACPFRALDPGLLEDAVYRMYGFDRDLGTEIVAATVLADPIRRAAFVERIQQGQSCIVYFQNKLGGEISISPTERSPQMSFDATMIEVLPTDDGSGIGLGRYAIFEIQTMDFHGSYESATKNLSDALRLHRDGFAEAVSDHPEWTSERVQGPNISNVFKRTFYQMMFKFRIGAHNDSAGCVFAIPRAVWDSWQKHLGAPELVDQGDGTWRLKVDSPNVDPSAWIYVFDLDESGPETPERIKLWRVIGTDAESLAHYALTVAPDAALSAGGSVDNITATIRKRLTEFLPELAGASASGGKSF